MTKLGSLNKDTDIAKVQELSNLSANIAITTANVGILSTDIELPEVSQLNTNFTNTTSRVTNAKYNFIGIQPKNLFARITDLSDYSGEYMQLTAITLITRNAGATPFAQLKVVASKDSGQPLDPSNYIGETDVQNFPATSLTQVKFTFTQPITLNVADTVYFCFYNDGVKVQLGNRSVEDLPYDASKIPILPDLYSSQFGGYWIPHCIFHFSTTRGIKHRLISLEELIG